MTPFEAYMTYLALKQHFTHEGYDYYKYNGKVRANPQSFEIRKDKYFFYKLSKKDDLLNYLVSNLSQNPDTWAGDLINEKGDEIYKEWKKRIESLSYNFKIELSNMHEDFNQNFLVEDGQQPYIIRLLSRKKISLETAVIIDDIVGFVKVIDKQIDDRLVWPQIKMKIMKYKPFVKFDKVKFKKILQEKFYAETE